MKWQKKGLIYAPSGELWWARSYAHLPTVDVVDDRIMRVYFASLDENKFGRVGYVDLDIDDPRQIVHVAREPVLDVGELGAFDDSGVNPSCIVDVGGKKYMYYIGWQRCERVPYMLFAGLAISGDGGKTFKKHSRVPVLDRDPAEPFSRSAPFVFVENGTFKVWYWSCEYWSVENGWVHYNNVIRYAESSDGIHWNRLDHTCIAPEGTEDYAVGRPWVIKDDDVYKMWYSIRSKAQVTYRMGYAESEDGMQWIKKGEDVGIYPSENGWDSEMICYPCVVDVKGKRYMFYNGNRHGASGFGYAALEETQIS
jgi:predicted GH43/DUF377 family glycosyl hydrolase